MKKMLLVLVLLFAPMCFAVDVEQSAQQIDILKIDHIANINESDTIVETAVSPACATDCLSCHSEMADNADIASIRLVYEVGRKP